MGFGTKKGWGHAMVIVVKVVVQRLYYAQREPGSERRVVCLRVNPWHLQLGETKDIEES